MVLKPPLWGWGSLQFQQNSPLSVSHVIQIRVSFGDLESKGISHLLKGCKVQDPCTGENHTVDRILLLLYGAADPGLSPAGPAHPGVRKRRHPVRCSNDDLAGFAYIPWTGWWVGRDDALLKITLAGEEPGTRENCNLSIIYS